MKTFLFRFFFLFFLLTTAPWLWFYQIPGVTYLYEFYGSAEEWIVRSVNHYLLHIKDVLNIDGGGSGDTSYGWAQFYTYILFSVLGCLVWTLLDRKKHSYVMLDFCLSLVVRYFVALTAFTYGIIKLFALQMPFPNLSLLATPLGDLLPMRLTWIFIGYSIPYQMFSGVMECTVGLLLLSRRTTTLGSLLGLAVFGNVLILNLSYDIPVKLFSMQIVFCCIYLLSRDWNRLFNFFLLNKPVEPAQYLYPSFTKKSHKLTKVALKLGFIVLFVAFPFYDSWNRYKEELSRGELKPIKSGMYTINMFMKNKEAVPLPAEDEGAWKDFIFEKGGLGSISTSDTLFRQRYRRGYFIYQPDSLKGTIAFKKTIMDSLNLFEMKYRVLDDRTMELWGKVRSDSLYFRLVRKNRHFQLAEKQFHWISEANR